MPDLFDAPAHVSGASYAPPLGGALVPLAIRGTEIRRDAEGRYCLNDCHRAAGGAKKHGPSYFFATDATKALVDEIGTTAKPVVTIEGRAGGTFAVKELVYAYAMWISPAFHLAVIRAFDGMITGAAPAPAPMGRAQLMAQAVLIAQETIQQQAEQIAYLEPRAHALERLAGRKGSETITDAAKALKMRPSELFAWLHEHKWAYKKRDGAPWRAYQDKIDQGLLIHVESPDPNHSDRTWTCCRITPKGRARIAELLEIERRSRATSRAKH